MKQATFFASLFLAIAIPRFVMSQQSVPEAATNGKHRFNQSVAACHDTLGSASKTGPELKNYYRQEPRPADATVCSTIRQGRGKMPAFTTLNKTGVDDLLAYPKLCRDCHPFWF